MGRLLKHAVVAFPSVHRIPQPDAKCQAMDTVLSKARTAHDTCIQLHNSYQTSVGNGTISNSSLQHLLKVVMNGFAPVSIVFAVF
jgi:hypothetical protein